MLDQVDQGSPQSNRFELLTLDQLATLLHRAPSGLRSSLQSNTPFGAQLRAARVKLGRRVYFRLDKIAAMIEAATGH